MFFVVVLVFTWLAHYTHSAKVQTRAHEYRRHRNAAGQDDTTTAGNDDTRVVDSDQVFEDIVSVRRANPV